MLETLFNNFNEIISKPNASFTLLGVFILICFSMYMSKIKLTTKMLVYISLMLAFAIILQQLRIYHFPQGGNVTLGSMIPILLLSYRYGVSTGALTGFLFGLIDILLDPFILHPIQVLFDYPLPYMSLGLAALIPAHKFISTLIAFTARFICHFISGVVFFAEYAPEGMSPIIYSLTANASYFIPECIICFIILKLMPIDRLLKFMDKNG